MPWKVFEDGSQFCVHKLSPSGGKGKKVGCHSSRSKANGQLRALHASESKSKSKAKELKMSDSPETKEETTKERLEKGFVPWGVNTWEALDAAREARDMAMKAFNTADDFVGLVSDAMGDSDISDIGSHVETLAAGFKQRVTSDTKTETKSVEEITSAVINKVKSWLNRSETEEPLSESLMLWKEADGQFRWLARYSNNFRDDDIPKEIISEKSHRRFVELVDKGKAPLPEYWLWHVKEWKLGNAAWVAYDDSGFALAFGMVDKGKEEVAEWISKQAGFSLSHGMPIGTIKRDPNDPTVIVEHETREISSLPTKAAANTLGTDLEFIKEKSKEDTEEADMTIPLEKRDALIKDWNMSPHLLDKLEQANADVADKGNSEGIENKEKEQDTTEQPPATDTDTTDKPDNKPEQDTDKDKKEPDATDPLQETPSRQEIADAVTTILTPVIEHVDSIGKAVTLIAEQVKELKEADEEKIGKALTDTPTASLKSLLFKSVVGDKGTDVSDTDLAKKKPAETKADDTKHRTGVPFIDEMLMNRS